MKAISCPANMTQNEVHVFWALAGYRKGKDFNFIKKKNRLYIKAKTQMILAQDGLKLGFKIVDI